MFNRKKRALGAVSAVAALALAGGIAAQFTTSTTSAPQNIGTGTLALSLDSVAPTAWTDDIANLAAGDSVERFVDLRNSGSLKFSGITLAQTNTLGSLLSAPSDVSITLQGCAVAWNATTGVCSTGAVDVLGSSSVRAWGTEAKALSTFEDFGAGEIRHLKLKTTLAAGATNAVQGAKGTITYTFGGVQRAPGQQPISDATTILGSSATMSTSSTTSTGSTFSFSDPTNGKATYSVTWAPTGNAAAAQTQVLPKGATSYNLTGLSAGTTYSVTLNAQLGVQKSSSSTTLSTTPLAPSNLAVSNLTASGSRVSWTDTSGGKATYTLTYTPAGGTAVNMDLPVGTTAFDFSGLASSMSYSVSLVAKAGGVSSAPATTSFTTSSAAAPSTVMAGTQMPTGTVASGGSYSSNNTPDKAIDNNSATNWMVAGNNGSFTLTMPSPTTVSSVRLITGTYYAANTTITVRGKNASGVWSQIGSKVQPTPANVSIQVSVPVAAGSYSALEITVANSDTSWASVQEITLNG